MQIIPRVSSPVVFTWIEDHLQTTDEWNKEQLVEHFTSMLVHAPEQILITVAIDGEECVGFLISIAAPNNPTVFIAQAWLKPGVDQVVSATAFSICLKWCKQLGRKRVKCETQRGEGMVRKWGFSPYSEILAFDIPDNLNPTEIIERMTKKAKTGEFELVGYPGVVTKPMESEA